MAALAAGRLGCCVSGGFETDEAVHGALVGALSRHARLAAGAEHVAEVLRLPRGFALGELYAVEGIAHAAALCAVLWGRGGRLRADAPPPAATEYAECWWMPQLLARLACIDDSPTDAIVAWTLLDLEACDRVDALFVLELACGDWLLVLAAGKPGFHSISGPSLFPFAFFQPPEDTRRRNRR